MTSASQIRHGLDEPTRWGEPPNPPQALRPKERTK